MKTSVFAYFVDSSIGILYPKVLKTKQLSLQPKDSINIVLSPLFANCYDVDIIIYDDHLKAIDTIELDVKKWHYFENKTSSKILLKPILKNSSPTCKNPMTFNIIHNKTTTLQYQLKRPLGQFSPTASAKAKITIRDTANADKILVQKVNGQYTWHYIDHNSDIDDTTFIDSSTDTVILLTSIGIYYWVNKLDTVDISKLTPFNITQEVRINLLDGDTAYFPWLMLEYYYAQMIHHIHGLNINDSITKVSLHKTAVIEPDSGYSGVYINLYETVICGQGPSHYRGCYEGCIIKINKSGAYLSTMAHEFGHYLGLVHENELCTKKLNESHLMTRLSGRYSYNIEDIFQIFSKKERDKICDSSFTALWDCDKPNMCPCSKISLTHYYYSYGL